MTNTTSEHNHTFGQQEVKSGEQRTLLVVIITAVMMVAEIVFGIKYGSMALLADGLHMASHAAALGVSYLAYVFARRYAADFRLSFGSGKLNSLAAFTSAIMLAIVSLVMLFESTKRMFQPVSIAFNEAIFIAMIGLIVNGLSVWVLRDKHEHHHEHAHHDHSHHHDHNLRAAYFHVLADALTSVLAIVALLGGKYYGWNWLDPAMGIVGAILVGRWSIGLIKVSASVLLDRQAPDAVLQEIRSILEADGQTTITDLHVWSIGPGVFAGEISLRAHHASSPDDYRKQLASLKALAHVTIEVAEEN